MMRSIGFGILAMSAWLGGCASPDPTFYTLQVVPGAILSAPASSVEVRRPGLAGYLDRSDMVLKNADYRLNVNSQMRWGEPLGDMIGRVMTQDIAQRLPNSSVYGESGAITADANTRVEVDVQRFDEDADGQVKLVAEVALERGRTHHPVATLHIDIAASPAGPGTANVVAAMSGLLGRLADQVASDLKAAGNAT
jgi:uncharacterized lipoprotein YmbA